MPVKMRKIRDSYLALINELPLRKIRSAIEHQQALAIFSRYAGRPKLDEGVVDYLGVLADLIADFERRAGYAIDTSDLTAADVVRHLMEENRLTISGLAREIGVGQSNLSEILSGKREWSKKVIKALSERFSLNPMLFLA
jgi:antitoxin component HigA of HigAB toxin-antitoxin module